jgi:hypothetical protein
MSEVFLFVVVAVGIGLIIMAARNARTRISLRGEERPLPDSSGDRVDSLLLTGILDGSSTHHGAFHGDTSHHGSCDTGSHDSSGFDCGSHGGFDRGGHH